MRPCHICEKIIRLQKSVSCSSCKRGFCYICISKYFPQKTDLPKLKVPKCFVCTKQCKCLKCSSAQNIVISNNRVTIQLESSQAVRSLVSEQEPITQLGLFRGKKISELPLYLQRIYLKKKVLYSMHQLSSPVNDKNNELQNNQQGQRHNLTQQQKGVNQIDQSIIIPQEQPLKQSQNNGKNQLNQNQDDEEQLADDYESQYASKRAAHLHSNQNEAIDQEGVEEPNENNDQIQGEQMVDENAQNQSRRRRQLVAQALQKRMNDSEDVEQINQE